MKTLSYLLLLVAAIVIIGLSVANRHVVFIYGMPDLTAYGFPAPGYYETPLYVVALVCVTFGFLLGALREYLRETRFRRQSSNRGREIGELKREVQTLRKQQNLDEDDEILALTTR
jgi:hypothetical protein